MVTGAESWRLRHGAALETAPIAVIRISRFRFPRRETDSMALAMANVIVVTCGLDTIFKAD
jgi:hypothetical protein